MFTGIVEAIGTVSNIAKFDESESGGGGTSLTISGAEEILGDVRLGDSINVNGTCLTVTAYDASSFSSSSSQPDTFKVGLSPETLRRTNLGSLAVSSRVNLERAVAASSRMGGHFVQGHVDTVAEILSTKEDGNALVLRLRPRDRSVLRYVVEKGYVALDGASLTVTAVAGGDGDGDSGGGGDGKGWFEIMLVAYTQEKIVTAKKGKGDEVNVEVDMVGKYVEKNVAAYFAAEGEKGRNGWIQKIIEQTVSKTAGGASG